MSFVILLLGLLVFLCVSSGAPSAKDQTRIADGTPSAQDKWPFIAAIFYNGEFIPICGGVVWDKDTILTAAHCILTSSTSSEPKYYEIYLGHIEYIFQKNQAYLFKAKEIITHPEFELDGFKNDIALIRLERSIDFDGVNSKVQCACDPEPLDLLDPSACVTMGWGRDAGGDRPDTLQEVVLPILDNVKCARATDHFNANYHLCVGFGFGGTCTGDSGGPLVCPQKADPAKYSLVGIASFGFPPCGTVPDYFTKVDNYLEWIGMMTSHEVSTTSVTNWWDKHFQ